MFIARHQKWKLKHSNLLCRFKIALNKHVPDDIKLSKDQRVPALTGVAEPKKDAFTGPASCQGGNDCSPHSDNAK